VTVEAAPHRAFALPSQLERARVAVVQRRLTGILTKNNPPLSRLAYPRKAALSGLDFKDDSCQLEIAWLGSSCKAGFRIPDFPRLGGSHGHSRHRSRGILLCSCQLQEPLAGPRKPMYLQAAALEPTSIWPRFTLHEVKMRFVTLLLSLPSSSQLLPFTYDRPSLWWRSFGHIVASLPIPVAIKKVEKHQFGCYAAISAMGWDHWDRARRERGCT
jgi:hypothetical protein